LEKRQFSVLVKKNTVLLKNKTIFFFWFFGEVSEQSDQVAWKPDFLLKTGNNDPKTEEWELGRLILFLKW